ncbi:MAG: hypothetical protein GTO51_11145 [Candidatus Latescibacteria bacterium]|nr:hypothetical protein [Candidatus Latescibacterota bacterium]NIM66519.1 hypothetical protein [Candidatus Latescibacterota bacterium]NIO02999.1 hypothetical protein [Candidatus Latescibacterota bacterium]NIO30134.1 hypothetical protein [Candidatus Latescibacterota bacterium]NIO57753.1 hypothetical protein [Candidatus Latescibacterota bacterium]
MTFLIKTLVMWRKFIVSSALVAAAAMAVVSLLLPKWYTARTSIFPPEPQGSVPAYAEFVQSLQLPLFGGGGVGAQSATIYIDILMSRKVGEQITEEFGLKRVYGSSSVTEALGSLHSHSTFRLLENGLLIIQFEDRDPERAASVANRFVELLDEFNQELNSARASKTREFIARQLEIHGRDLQRAEEELRVFQEQNQALEISEQVKSTLEVMSDLTGEAIALEVEMDILGQYASESSEEYVDKKERYDEILGQLKKFKVNSARDEEDFVRSFFPTLDKVPEVTLDLLRLTRRVKIEEKVYELLIKEHEKARIDEARDTPTIQVLDRAEIPEIRSRPKRKILVVLGGLVGFGWSALLAVMVTLWREQEEQRGVVKEIFGPVLNDISRIFRRKK